MMNNYQELRDLENWLAPWLISVSQERGRFVEDPLPKGK